MKSTGRISPKFVKHLHKALLLVYLQLLAPGCLADLVVKEKDIADLQLDHLQAQAELVEDTTLPLQCRRQVKHTSFQHFKLVLGTTQNNYFANAIFSYSSSSTLYPCQSLIKWGEFQTSVASRLLSLFYFPEYVSLLKFYSPLCSQI